jgi:hypothetical protein
VAELLISEITRMKAGHCVLGLERNQGNFRSIRPMPPSAIAWRGFPYQRTDRVAFSLSVFSVIQPHFEDRQAADPQRLGSVTERELVGCLKLAEVAASVQELFGCPVHPSARGGPSVWVNPDDARRSISGCEIRSFRFSFRLYPASIRVALVLPSGEILESLPVVDRDWHEFIALFEQKSRDVPHLGLRLEKYFNSFIHERIMTSPIRFARIGLARPDKDGCCWLMLDSLFPLPQREWLRAL